MVSNFACLQSLLGFHKLGEVCLFALQNNSLARGPSQSSSVFELLAGQLVDLGVYAPSTNEECKNEQVVVMKNFLMQDFAESYSFAKAACDKNDFDLFDVTQDDRPALTKSAAENRLVFANESDGKTEVPSLVCRYDAEGSIHYLMGHDDEDCGPLVIPMDKDFELKVYLMFSSLLSYNDMILFQFRLPIVL